MAEVEIVAAVPEVTSEVKSEVTEVKEEVKTEEVIPEPVSKTYTQEELDRITAKVKKNARYQARKETEAFYKGRDSRPEVNTESADIAPLRENFENYEDYLEAKASYVGRTAAHEARIEAEHKARTTKEQDDRKKSFDDFRSKVQEKYPDLEERLEEISEIVMPHGMGQAIAESSSGPDILDYFAKNPKDCERIAALSPSSAIREIGRLETKLESKPEPKKTIASKAPAPIKPGGGASPSDETPQDSDTTAEWIRKEEARWRKRTAS